MKALEVRPLKWLQDPEYQPRVLYDDDEYSFIWGKYENIPALGARWNVSEESKRGYPGFAEHPTWYVEPDFIAITILHRLRTMAIEANDLTYLENIRFAIEELQIKMLGRNNQN